MRLLNVVSELHLPSNAVPVIPEVFVDVQIPDSPLHVHVRRLLKKLTGDTCSPDHFQVLPEEHAKREHKQQDERVIGAIRVIKQFVLGVVGLPCSHLWLWLIEEYLAVTKLPVAKENHEEGRVIQDLEGSIVHRWTVQRGLSIVISKQVSL